MKGLARIALVALVSFSIPSCGLPPLVLLEDQNVAVAPSGPTVAALIANIKCELWEAANDTSPLPYYRDIPALTVENWPDDPDRNFNLRNLFTEVEYVADFKLTLQVTDTGALNPSVNFVHPYAATSTNLTLAVGGQISDQGDRILDLFQTVDFARLVPSLPVNHAYRVGVPGFKPFDLDHLTPPVRSLYAPGADVSVSPCTHGQGLAGSLGLKGSLASYAIAARMQDVAVLLQQGSSGATLYGQTPSLSSFNSYAFGQMDTQIDFTVSMDLNGGPNWTLTKFKGPTVSSAGGSNGSGLLNVSRLAKDTLIVTAIPVCIRERYFPNEWKKVTPPPPGPSGAPYEGRIEGTVPGGKLQAKIQAWQDAKPELPLKYPLHYSMPKMFYGTPVWANYLPPCLSAAGQAALAQAQGAARANTQIEGINNLLQQSLPRM